VELSQTYSLEWATQRLTNLFHSIAIQLQDILWRFGMTSVRDLVGRSDLLSHQDYGAGVAPTAPELAAKR
jgi:glutamate synthase domain-containing protein 2